MVFAVKIVFSKRKIPKFSRLRRGYTPSNPKIFGACSAATVQVIIQNIDVVQKVIIQKVIIQIVFMKRLLHKHFSNLHAAIALSTHAQNVWKRKSAPQARKKRIQELKQSFLTLKTW